MVYKNQAYFFVVLQLYINAVISAGNSGISENPSKGNSNPVHRGFDERKISKRHNELDFQTCLDNFEIHQDKIIRTQDSRAMGARYINERDVPSRDDCLRLCCETQDCDVFVFEERSPGSCYLFQCGTPEEFKCKFTKHRNYTSAVLPINRHITELESQIKLTKHEHELTNLRQSDSSPTAIVSMTNTESTISPDNKETYQLIPSSSSNSSVNSNRRCSRYQFECRSSEECIAIYNACDGIPQCSDGSDEAPELGCPASLTTIIPAERVSQGEVPVNLAINKINVGTLPVLPPQGNHHNHQSISIEGDQHIQANKEFSPDSWAQQSTGYRPDEHTQLYRHHQELQLDLQQRKPTQQQLLDQPQPVISQPQQTPERQRQLELQNQQLLQESEQQKLLQEQQQQMHQHVTAGGNYMVPNNRIQPQQMLTMSSQIPQQHQQIPQPPQIIQSQQSPQLDNMQPSQQLMNQAKLYGREGEGLIHRSQAASDQRHWPSNYQSEPNQENLSYHIPNNGMSQIFSHKGNGLVSQSERTGNQFVDPVPNEFSRYSNYFDNNQYRMLPHNQQNWQSGRKSIHDVNQMEEIAGGSHEGESPIQPGLNQLGADYYYEENMRNKIQQQLSQQRLAPQNNLPVAPAQEQLMLGQYPEMKNPVHEEITLEHVNHDSVSTGQGPSVKKASAHHPSLDATTEKPKDVKTHHHGHSSHRKIEQLTAEVTLRETSFDGVTMDQSNPSGAILALALGMCVTSVMVILVACRMRTVRRRMRRGKSGYAHDADFLVNGMYL